MKIATFPSLFPVLETERLLLRQPVDADEDLIFKLYHNPQIVRYIMEPIQTHAEAKAILRSYIDDFYSKERIFWTITNKNSLAPIGTCCYEWFHTPGLGEIGYDLLPDQQGQGYMRETLPAILRFGFDVLHLEEIEAFITPQNLPSIHVLQKLGFRICGEKDGDRRLFLKRT